MKKSIQKIYNLHLNSYKMKIDAYKILDAIPLQIIQQYLKDKVEPSDGVIGKPTAAQKKEKLQQEIRKRFYRRM